MMNPGTNFRNLIVACMLACACGYPAFGVARSQAVASPNPSNSPQPLPSSQPATLAPRQIALVRGVYLGLLAGKIDRKLFDARMNELLDPVSLASLKKSLAPYGPPSIIISSFEQITPTYRVVDYTFKFSGARSLTIRFTFASGGKISGLSFPEKFQ